VLRKAAGPNANHSSPIWYTGARRFSAQNLTSQSSAFFFGRSPTGTATSTGRPCQKKLAGSMIMSDWSGRIQSGSGLVGTSQPQTNSWHGCCGRSG